MWINSLLLAELLSRVDDQPHGLDIA